MADPLATVLQLVADGRLTAAQAAPIIDALGDVGIDEPGPGPAGHGAAADQPAPSGDQTAGSGGKAIRIEVSEGGRRVVNLRIPVSLGRMALDRIPGLSGSHADMVRRALDDGRSGTLLHIDEEGNGVRIALE